MNRTTETKGTYVGSCHCKAVRFEADLDLAAGGTKCNCSICTKVSGLQQLTKPSAVRLLTGEDALGAYAWGSKVGVRHFCTRCGIHVFSRGHLEQLGGDFASVNLNTLDDVELTGLQVIYWDGRHDNWAAGPRATPWPMLSNATS